MMFGVPQYIDVEDKIAGPLTARQFLWMLGMGAVLIILWNILEVTAFFIAAIPIGGIFAALAFYRPSGIPLIEFLSYAFIYMFQPKIYIWRRMNDERKSDTGSKSDVAFETKYYKQAPRINQGDIAAIARTLDSEGAVQTDRFVEIMEREKEKVTHKAKK